MGLQHVVEGLDVAAGVLVGALFLAAVLVPELIGERRIAWLLLVAALVLTGVVYLFIGKTFMPTMDEGDIIVQLEKLPSITLEQSVEFDRRVEAAILAAVPEVTRIVARVGSDEIGMDPMGLNETDVFMVLQPRSEWRMDTKDELIAEIRQVLERFPGIAYGFTQPIEMRVSEMLTGSRGDLAVKIFGQDIDTLNRLAGEVAGTLQSVEGSTDVLTGVNEGMQYVVLRPRREVIGRRAVGVRLEAVLGVLRHLGAAQQPAHQPGELLRREEGGRAAAEVQLARQVHEAAALGIDRQSVFCKDLEFLPEPPVFRKLPCMGFRKPAADVEGVHSGNMAVRQGAGKDQACAGGLEGVQVFRVVELKGRIPEDADDGGFIFRCR